MEDSTHYTFVSKILRKTVLELHVFSQNLLRLENLIRRDIKQIPDMLKSDLAKWSLGISSASDKVLELLLDHYTKESWKDKVTVGNEFREHNSSLRLQVFPEFIDAKVERKIHFKSVEKFMEQLFPLPALRKTLDDSDTRFENYLKMMTSNGDHRKQKKAIEKIQKFDNQVELKKILKEKNDSITSERFKEFLKRLDITISYKKMNYIQPNSKSKELIIIAFSIS